MQMSNAEICSSFRQAKNQNDQISILAELNACSTAEILEILQAGGCITGLPVAKKAKTSNKATNRLIWTAELDKQLIDLVEAGNSNEKIAEIMGLEYLQVKNRRDKLKRKGYLFKRSADDDKSPDEEATVENTPMETSGGVPVGEKFGVTVESLGFLVNSLPYGAEQISAAVRFADDAGNVWKLELCREY